MNEMDLWRPGDRVEHPAFGLGVFKGPVGKESARVLFDRQMSEGQTEGVTCALAPLVNLSVVKRVGMTASNSVTVDGSSIRSNTADWYSGVISSASGVFVRHTHDGTRSLGKVLARVPEGDYARVKWSTGRSTGAVTVEMLDHLEIVTSEEWSRDVLDRVTGFLDGRCCLTSWCSEGHTYTRGCLLAVSGVPGLIEIERELTNSEAVGFKAEWERINNDRADAAAGDADPGLVALYAKVRHRLAEHDAGRVTEPADVPAVAPIKVPAGSSSYLLDEADLASIEKVGERGSKEPYLSLQQLGHRLYAEKARRREAVEP